MTLNFSIHLPPPPERGVCVIGNGTENMYRNKMVRFLTTDPRTLLGTVKSILIFSVCVGGRGGKHVCHGT